MQRVTAIDDIKNLGAILGIWAHPDDETFTMAGIMAAAVQNGQKVAIITATRGEAGVQDESRWPAAQLADIRTRELSKALKILGVTEHHWLDYHDGRCVKVDQSEAVSRIAGLIRRYSPDSILTFGPDGMTGHDDHKTVSEWAGLAARQAGSPAVIYHAIQTYEQYENMVEADRELNVFFNTNRPRMCEDCDCDVCFCLDDELFKLKIKALKAMPSQTEAMLKKFSHVLPKSVGTEAFVKAN